AQGRTVVEVPDSTPLWQLHDMRQVQAVLVGGFGGTWMDPFAFGQLRAGSLALGLLLPLPRDACGIDYTAAIVDYLAASSAGQCGPCRFGLRAIADVLADLVDLRARRRDARRLQRTLAEIAGRGACHHPDGAVRVVASALRTFGADVRAHLYGSTCRHAGAEGFFPVPEGHWVGRHEVLARLRVDPVACDGIGICQHVAPTLVRADSWGYPIVSDRPLRGAGRRAADAAVASCPRRALFVDVPPELDKPNAYRGRRAD